jgi:hypothetical protein
VTKSVQLNVNDDTFRRLRIRTGRLPVSFAAGDEDKLRCEVSKSPYYSLLARAVSQLPKNTRTARLALYDRAEVALTAALLHPEISDEQTAWRTTRGSTLKLFADADDASRGCACGGDVERVGDDLQQSHHLH